MSYRDDHELLRVWTTKHTAFAECGCGWCSPTSDTYDQAMSWWEQHARQMRRQAVEPLRAAFRRVLALHGRVSVDDLDTVLDELVTAATSPSTDPGVHVSTRVTGGAQNAPQGAIR